MADTQTPTAAAPADGQADVIKNVKAEMDRKIQNMSDTLKQTTEALKQQLAAMKAPVAPPAQPSQAPKSYKDKFYEDEDAALNEVKEITKKEIRAELLAENRQKEVINKLYTEFPEIGDPEHELTKKAVEIYESLPKHEQGNPISYRAAVLDAAAELGIAPAKKRKKESTDEYTGNAGNPPPPGRTAKGDLDPRTHAFASLMGLNMNDPKQVESLKKRSERHNWNTYE